MKYYSLYKGDKEIAFGSLKEIAVQLGVEQRTISFYKTPTYKKRCGNYTLVYVPELSEEEIKCERNLINDNRRKKI